MSRAWRLLAGLWLLAGLVLATGARPVAAEVRDPVQRLGACMVAGRPSDVLLVLDTSGSLQQTDPTNERVSAAKYLVGQLISFAKDNHVNLSVAIAGFDSKYRVSTGWTAAQSANQSALDADLDQYRKRNTGWETDYWNAVQGARRTLAARAAGSTSHCQAWVWFTDGSYDLDVRNTGAKRAKYGTTKAYSSTPLTSKANVAKVTKAGISDLCRKGGLADQIRIAGPITLAVGLSAPGDGDANFGLMKGIATASGGTGGPACSAGAATTPGAFVQADDVDDVVFAFNSFASPGQTAITSTTKLCPRTACTQQAHNFVLDSSIGSVHILANSSVASSFLVLGRDGSKSTVRIDPGKSGRTNLLGVGVSYSWVSAKTAAIDLRPNSSSSWAGAWSLAFVDPLSATATGRARSSITLQGDILPSWQQAKTTTLRAGKSTQASFALVRSGSTETIDPASIEGSAELTAALVGSNGKTVPIVTGATGAAIGQNHDIDLSSIPTGPATVRLTLELTTKGARTASGKTIAGTTLSPRTVDIAVQVLPPAHFPKVAQHLNLGETQSSKPIKAAVHFTGSGCVWFDGKKSSTTLPAGVSGPKISSKASSRASCVRSESGGGTVPLTFTFKGKGNGAANGTVTVLTAPKSGNDNPVSVTVPYTLEMRTPRNETAFGGLLIALTLAGVLIPIGMLYGAKWWASRIPGNSMLVARFRGTVDADGRFKPEGGGELRITPNDLRTVILTGTNRRRIALDGGGELVAKTGLSPVAAGYVVLKGAGPASGSSESKAMNKRLEAILPTSVVGRWVVAVDGTDAPAGAECLFFLNATGQGVDELTADARDRVPDVVARLRDGLLRRGSSPSDNDGLNADEPTLSGSGTDSW